MEYDYPDRDLDPPEGEDVPVLNEAMMAEVLDELNDDWRQDYDDVVEAFENAMAWNPHEVERLSIEVHAAHQSRAMTDRATEKAIADGLIDEITAQALLPALMRRQAE